MKIHITMGKASAPYLVQVLSYGDPYSTSADGVPDIIRYFELTLENYEVRSNFRHFDFWSPSGHWGAVSNFYKSVDYAYLKSLQPNPSQAVMNWLVGTDDGPVARPLWWHTNADMSRSLRCGTSVFGGNPVQIETIDGQPKIYEFYTEYVSHYGGRQMIPFYKMVGLPRSEMYRVSHTTHPQWIHRCSEAIWLNGHDSINWYPKGETIYYPCWDFRDWETNTKTEDMYIAVKGTRPI